MVQNLEIYVCTLVSDWDNERMHVETFIANSAEQAKEWAFNKKTECSISLNESNTKGSFEVDEDGSYICYLCEDDGEAALTYGWEKVTVKKEIIDVKKNLIKRLVDYCVRLVDFDDVEDAVRDIGKYRSALHAINPYLNYEFYDYIRDFCEDNEINEDELDIDNEDLLFKIYNEITC